MYAWVLGAYVYVYVCMHCECGSVFVLALPIKGLERTPENTWKLYTTQTRRHDDHLYTRRRGHESLQCVSMHPRCYEEGKEAECEVK